MKFSINPLTQQKYNIPETLDDSKNIENFICAHEGKKVIVVQGLGFVGAVMSLVCANALTDEYAVIGVDLANENTYWKIKSINDGIFPLTADDPKIDKFFENTKENGNFLATYDPKAFQYADVIIVDINLDVQKQSHEKGGLKDFDINLNDLCLNFTRLKKIIFVAIKKIKKNNRYAAFDIKKNQIISLNAQKKNYSLINSGNYVVSKKILKYLEKNCSLENDIFKKLIKKKQFFGKVYNKPLNLFIDIGIYTDLNRSPKFLKKVMQKRALFLDRDGVINKDTGYVHEKQKFIWRKNIFRFIKKYNDNGYYVFVVSNQSGIGRGYYKESDLFKLNFWINQQLRRKGANIDEFFFAPFFKNSKLKKYRRGKKLRKPNTGMIEIAKKKWDIDIKNSTLIGDQKTDKLTAINAGINFKILKFKSILK